MSYQKLLLEYAQTHGENDRPSECGRRRLRWEKDEAMGNSKFRWTGTKVRYAHVVNRNLQMKLHKNVSVWAKTHGSKCNEIEAKQREVWNAQLKRNTRIGSSYSTSIAGWEGEKRTPKISEPLYPECSRRATATISRSRLGSTPFSTAGDFSIYKKPFEPTEQRKYACNENSNSRTGSRDKLSLRHGGRSRDGGIGSRSTTSSFNLGDSFVTVSRLGVGGTGDGVRGGSLKTFPNAEVMSVH
eukprot:gene9237-10211_t